MPQQGWQSPIQANEQQRRFLVEPEQDTADARQASEDFPVGHVQAQQPDLERVRSQSWPSSKAAMPTQLRIGCSGWSYDHWAAPVYGGAPKNEWLGIYQRIFDTVELNASFYRTPNEQTWKNWNARSPLGFIFAVKGSRYVTHLKRLLDPEPGVENLQSRARLLGPHLGPILWQLPPDLEFDQPRLARFLAALDGGLKHAIEFRHPSWANPATVSLLERFGVAAVRWQAGDVSFFLPQTAAFEYLRLHGPLDFYRGSYRPGQLQGVVETIGSLDAGAVYVYFNNDMNAYAPKNALALRRLAAPLFSRSLVNKHPAPHHDQKSHGRRGVVSLTTSRERAWTGAQKPLHADFGAGGKKILGDYGEVLGLNILQALGLAGEDAYKPDMGKTKTGMKIEPPMDLIDLAHRRAYEVKIGFVSTNPSSRAWRIGPGPVSGQDTSTSTERQEAAMKRRQDFVAGLQDAHGDEFEAYTLGLIADPDEGKVDAFLIPGIHRAVTWKRAEPNLVGSFSYDHGEALAAARNQQAPVEERPVPSDVFKANTTYNIVPDPVAFGGSSHGDESANQPTDYPKRSYPTRGQPQVNEGMFRNAKLDEDWTHEHDGFPRHPIRVRDHPAYFQTHREVRPAAALPENPELRDRVDAATEALRQRGFRVRFDPERQRWRVTGRSVLLGGRQLADWYDWQHLVRFWNMELRARGELPTQTGEERPVDPETMGERSGTEVLDLGPMHDATWDHVLTREDVTSISPLRSAGIRGGIHGPTTFIVNLRDGSRGIYKAATDESEVERLFSKFAKQFLGEGLVPEVQAVDLGRGAGHVMKMVEGRDGDKVARQALLGTPRRVRSYAWMTALDVALGNPDRKSANILLDDRADRLWAIDNGLAFGEGLYHADPLRFDANSIGIPANLADGWYRELDALADRWQAELPQIEEFFDTNPQVRGRFMDDPPELYKKSVRWTIYSMRLAVKAWRERASGKIDRAKLVKKRAWYHEHDGYLEHPVGVKDHAGYFSRRAGSEGNEPRPGNADDGVKKILTDGGISAEDVEDWLKRGIVITPSMARHAVEWRTRLGSTDKGGPSTFDCLNVATTFDVGPKDIEEIYSVKDEGVTAKLYHITVGEERVRFDLNLKNRDGDNIGRLERKWSFNKNSVLHEIFVLEDAYQRHGIAAAMNAQAEERYRELGFKQISLYADIASGKYAWAQQGYDWSSEGDKSNMKARFKIFLKERFPQIYAEQHLSSQVEQIEHSWEMARFTVNGDKVGKHFMLTYADGWDGVKSLDPDSPGHVVGEAYLRTKIEEKKKEKSALAAAAVDSGRIIIEWPNENPPGTDEGAWDLSDETDDEWTAAIDYLQSSTTAKAWTHKHDGFQRHPIRVKDHVAYFQAQGSRSPGPESSGKSSDENPPKPSGEAAKNWEGGFHPECERKFRVDPARLPSLPRPWLLAQGYFDDMRDQELEHNIRVIASRGRAYRRIKSLDFGCRMKISDKIDLNDGIRSLYHADRVAFKERRLVRDETGRAWLIDHFLDEDWWQAETELAALDEPISTPDWCVQELTNDSSGYSRSHAFPRTASELAEFLSYAHAEGSRAPYDPAEMEEQGEEFQFSPIGQVRKDGGGAGAGASGPGGAEGAMTGAMVHTDTADSGLSRRKRGRTFGMTGLKKHRIQ